MKTTILFFAFTFIAVSCKKNANSDPNGLYNFVYRTCDSSAYIDSPTFSSPHYVCWNDTERGLTESWFLQMTTTGYAHLSGNEYLKIDTTKNAYQQVGGVRFNVGTEYTFEMRTWWQY
jgi:hypothetical protein